MGEQMAERIWYCWTESPETKRGSVMALVVRTPSPSVAMLRMVRETWMVESSSGLGGLA